MTNLHRFVHRSLDYPESVRWQHFLAPQPCRVDFGSADVTSTTKAALFQNRIGTLICISGQIRNKTKIRIHFYKILLCN